MLGFAPYMTMKEIGCTISGVVAALLIVDSRLYEHPMEPRPLPHNFLGRFLHGEWVRGVELTMGIALMLGTLIVGVLVILKARKTSAGMRRSGQ